MITFGRPFPVTAFGKGSIEATLIVVGKDDEITPPAESEEIHRGIPHSRLALLPECGHLPPLEYPELTKQLLGERLQN